MRTCFTLHRNPRLRYPKFIHYLTPINNNNKSFMKLGHEANELMEWTVIFISGEVFFLGIVDRNSKFYIRITRVVKAVSDTV